MKREILRVKIRTWIVAVVAVAVIGGLVAVMGERQQAVAQGPVVTTSSGGSGSASYANSLSRAFRDAAQKALPAVVMIKNTPVAPAERSAESGEEEQSEENNPLEMLPPEFRRLFPNMPRGPSSPRGEGATSLGSGFIIDPSGIILTNNHVVSGNGKITVRLHDGREFVATDVKRDPRSDLAIVRIKADNLPTVKLGNSDDMQVGDWVLALGDPFGLEGTVTAGIISAKGRGVDVSASQSFKNLIQTDAAINRGNSGGPLVNLDGDVIGINMAILSPTGGNLGVGFAIPSNVAKWVSQQLVSRGSVRRAYIGVSMQPLSRDLARQLGVEGQKGTVVAEIFPHTPAAAAGLKAGDVIVEFAGQPVTSPQDLQSAVEQARIGERQQIVVLRNGKRTSLDVAVQEQPADYGVAQRRQTVPGQGETAQDEKLGIEVSELTQDLANQLGVKAGEGVVITRVRQGSPAGAAGLTPKMIIVQANGKTIKTLDDFRKAMSLKSLKEGVLLLVRTAQGTRFLVIRSS